MHWEAQTTQVRNSGGRTHALTSLLGECWSSKVVPPQRYTSESSETPLSPTKLPEQQGTSMPQIHSHMSTQVGRGTLWVDTNR